MRRTMLVVDDEQPVRDLFSQAFSAVGWTVHQAAHAEEAQASFRRHGPPLAFVDLKLPGRSGLEVGRELFAANPLTILYAMTGYGSLFELADCREAGFEDYFLKPVRLQTLFAAAEAGLKKVRRWRGL
jgi:DNA-binding response OmpR family regulator